MAPHRAWLLLSLLVGLCLAQNPISGVTFTTTTAPGQSVPVFSATSSPPFTPTATGASPGAGTMVTITESGMGSTGTNPTGVFSFLRPFSSVAPTGNLTQIGLSGSGGVGGGGASNLVPDPTNLERAGAQRTSLDRLTLLSALLTGFFAITGAAWILA